MAQINPYLTFNGNCEEAFEFYKSVFGGSYKRISRFKDMPPMDGQPPMPESSLEKIMHIALPISKETVLMGSDGNPNYGPVNNGQSISLCAEAASKDEADRIFKGLSADGTVTMPMMDMFWGSYFGMLKDKYDHIWMINYEHAQNN